MRIMAEDPQSPRKRQRKTKGEQAQASSKKPQIGPSSSIPLNESSFTPTETPGSTSTPTTMTVPTFYLKKEPVIDFERFRKTYEEHRVVLIRGSAEDGDDDDDVDDDDDEGVLSNLGELMETLDDRDRETWSMETKGEVFASKEFLDPKKTGVRGYASFRVGYDGASWSLGLPHTELPLSSSSSNGNQRQRHGPCVWFFVGRHGKNRNRSDVLEGRPEHIDAVGRYDGTWHYQMSGYKKWCLRREINHDKDDDVSVSSDEEETMIEITCTCRRGDFLLLDTSAWWHRTLLPSSSGADAHTPTETKSEGEPEPSVSYAREVRFSTGEDNDDDDHSDDEAVMADAEGLYATRDIEADTIIFTEEECPADSELPRTSNNPNCELVELEKDSDENEEEEEEDDDKKTPKTVMAVVSVRKIMRGEFFTLPESDNEDDGNEDELEDLAPFCKVCPPNT